MAFVELTIRTGHAGEKVWTEQAWFNTNNILFIQAGSLFSDPPESVSSIWTLSDRNNPWIVMGSITSLIEKLKHAEKRWSDA